MNPSQRVFAILASLGTLVFILELVRRRRLREEYSWLWILTSATMILLVTCYGMVEWMTGLIGAVLPTTTLFIFAFLFLLLISVHFSTVISRLSQQVRRLTQELAILSAERDQVAERLDRPPNPDPPRST